jgi:hypothetical protein
MKVGEQPYLKILWSSLNEHEDWLCGRNDSLSLFR